MGEKLGGLVFGLVIGVIGYYVFKWFDGWLMWIGIVMMVFGVFAIIGTFSRGGGGSFTVRTCASCGWQGSSERWSQSKGCPQCGSDLYKA